MKLNKKDLFWSILLCIFPALALLVELIPGGAVLDSAEEPGVVLYRNLLMVDGWNFMGITASLLLLSTVYLMVLCICYWRSQSVGTLKGILIFAVVSLVISLMTMLTEQNLHVLPFLTIPLLLAAQIPVVCIRIKKESGRYGM